MHGSVVYQMKGQFDHACSLLFISFCIFSFNLQIDKLGLQIGTTNIYAESGIIKSISNSWLVYSCTNVHVKDTNLLIYLHSSYGLNTSIDWALLACVAISLKEDKIPDYGEDNGKPLYHLFQKCITTHRKRNIYVEP